MLTTIAISKGLKEKLKEFGNKGDTYEDILTRLYESASRRQLQDLLMDTKDTITLDDARRRLRAKYGQVVIVPSLYAAIEKRFKKQAHEIIDLFETLYGNPKKGKELGHVGSVVIKELKYGVYRFYFITDGPAIKFYTADELKDVLVRFVRMSDKDRQAATIEEIKIVLRQIGSEGFE